MTEKDLNKIEARVRNTTPGQWTPHTQLRSPDVEFAAAAREDVPALCSALRAARRRIEEMERALEEQRLDAMEMYLKPRPTFRAVLKHFDQQAASEPAQ